ncbi:MAG: 30S ribosomal protein S5 [Phycisphaeraceae bacterium]|nr:30S ribosomal protein S5 [Phycisphaeraceae bacterium]MCW5754341.1 30S ribosomal protein S5 [Phycisphaeraceae bacterium]
MEETAQIESHTVGVNRTAATVKGGRRFQFGALVIVGDRRGRVGYGYAKGVEVPQAIEKAQKVARRKLYTVPMEGTTIPHEVEGTYGASKVRLIPASPGTGVVAGGTIRALLEHAGITDCLTKCYGSTQSANLVKAAFDAIAQLRTSAKVAELRGLKLDPTITEERVARGRQFMPAVPLTPRIKKETKPEREQRGGRRRGGRGGNQGGDAGGAPGA